MAVVLAALVLAGCGGGGGTEPRPEPDPGPSTSNRIDVRDNSFSPRVTTVPVNTTVTWTWRGSNSHDVAFTDNVASPVQTSGTYERQFTAAGTYDYICNVHGSAMSGRVVVQ